MQFKPRNPVVPAMARRSGAGAHQKSRKAQRQAEQRQLRRAREEAGFAQHMHMC